MSSELMKTLKALALVLLSVNLKVVSAETKYPSTSPDHGQADNDPAPLHQSPGFALPGAPVPAATGVSGAPGAVFQQNNLPPTATDDDKNDLAAPAVAGNNHGGAASGAAAGNTYRGAAGSAAGNTHGGASGAVFQQSNNQPPATDDDKNNVADPAVVLIPSFPEFLGGRVRGSVFYDDDDKNNVPDENPTPPCSRDSLARNAQCRAPKRPTPLSKASGKQPMWPRPIPSSPAILGGEVPDDDEPGVPSHNETTQGKDKDDKQDKKDHQKAAVNVKRKLMQSTMDDHVEKRPRGDGAGSSNDPLLPTEASGNRARLCTVVKGIGGALSIVLASPFACHVISTFINNYNNLALPAEPYAFKDDVLYLNGPNGTEQFYLPGPPPPPPVEDLAGGDGNLVSSAVLVIIAVIKALRTYGRPPYVPYRGPN